MAAPRRAERVIADRLDSASRRQRRVRYQVWIRRVARDVAHLRRERRPFRRPPAHLHPEDVLIRRRRCQAVLAGALAGPQPANRWRTRPRRQPAWVRGPARLHRSGTRPSRISPTTAGHLPPPSLRSAEATSGRSGDVPRSGREHRRKSSRQRNRTFQTRGEAERRSLSQAPTSARGPQRPTPRPTSRPFRLRRERAAATSASSPPTCRLLVFAPSEFRQSSSPLRCKVSTGVSDSRRASAIRLARFRQHRHRCASISDAAARLAACRAAHNPRTRTDRWRQNTTKRLTDPDRSVLQKWVAGSVADVERRYG